LAEPKSDRLLIVGYAGYSPSLKLYYVNRIMF
jgi:hypothetical protein